jgi:hypothetical protein
MKTAAALVLSFLLAPIHEARAADPGTFTLQGSVGFGTQSLADVNHGIALDAASTQPLARSLDWGTFGSAMPIGLEASLRLSERWSAGVGITWQRNSLEHVAGLSFVETGVSYAGAQVEELELQLLNVYATGILWIPDAPGLHLGSQFGIAWGRLDRSTGTDLDGDDGSFFEAAGSGEAAATTLSAGVYLGYEVVATPFIGFSARLGYLHCDLGNMEGRYRFAGAFDGGVYRGWVNGPVRDSKGEAMDYDFSGLRASGVVTVRLGRIGGT